MPAADLLALSSVELRRLIGAKAVSPLELADAVIARIEALNPCVNAIAAKGYDRARREAKAAEQAAMRGDALGPLHGLPTAIKDLHETEGLTTTYGSPLHAGFVPKADSAMVANVRRVGAIVIAKTNVPEFGAGANTRNPVWGATGNPFDSRLNAGGSSGGSAVALALDMVPVCTGSDTGGSLRIPAAICGVVGFRPSPGLVPMEARALGWTPISVLGPMGRTVADTRQLFAAQIGFDDREPLAFPLDSADVARARPVDPATLRIGWTADFGGCVVSREIRAVMARKAAGMRHFFRSCDEVSLDFGAADRAFDVIRALNFVVRYREDYEKNPAALGPNIRANYEIGAAMSLADAAWAHGEQTRIFRRFQRVFDDFDLILSPVTPVTPFPWTTLALDGIEGVKLENYYRWLALTYYVTLVTNPSLALPCGRDDHDMPFGLQITGRFRGDAALLDAAEAMEAAFAGEPDLARPKPDAAKLKPNPDLVTLGKQTPENRFAVR